MYLNVIGVCQSNIFEARLAFNVVYSTNIVKLKYLLTEKFCCDKFLHNWFHVTFYILHFALSRIVLNCSNFYQNKTRIKRFFLFWTKITSFRRRSNIHFSCPDSTRPWSWGRTSGPRCPPRNTCPCCKKIHFDWATGIWFGQW